MCINTCNDLGDYLSNHPDLDECQRSAAQLTECLRVIHFKWLDHENHIETSALNLCSDTQRVTSHERGRPRFEVTKEQITHLASVI